MHKPKTEVPNEWFKTWAKLHPDLMHDYPAITLYEDLFIDTLAFDVNLHRTVIRGCQYRGDQFNTVLEGRISRGKMRDEGGSGPLPPV